MINSIIHEIANVGFTLFSAVVIAWVVLKLINYRIFENFRFDDGDENEDN